MHVDAFMCGLSRMHAREVTKVHVQVRVCVCVCVRVSFGLPEIAVAKTSPSRPIMPKSSRDCSAACE